MTLFFCVQFCGIPEEFCFILMVGIYSGVDLKLRHSAVLLALILFFTTFLDNVTEVTLLKYRCCGHVQRGHLAKYVDLAPDS